MADETKIQWCDYTFNPWRGCTKVAAGCLNCYAEKFSKRNPKVLGIWGDDGSRPVAAEAYWRRPLAWAKAAREAWSAGIVPEHDRPRVFCASLADVFEDREDLIFARLRLFRTIVATPELDWLLLTKRPQNIRRLIEQAIEVDPESDGLDGVLTDWIDGKPPKNVWLGTSVANNNDAHRNIPELLRVPAAKHFVSYEPAVGPVIFDVRWLLGWFMGCPEATGDPETDPCLGCDGNPRDRGGEKCYAERGPALDWIIVGGESGGGARPFNVEWALSVISQCESYGVACFVKQVGTRPTEPRSVILSDGEYLGEPTPLWDRRTGNPIKERSGGDMAEWPEALRVRQFPSEGKGGRCL